MSDTPDPRSALHGVSPIETPDDAARALSGYSTAGWAGLSPEGRNAWRDAVAHERVAKMEAERERIGQMTPEQVAERFAPKPSDPMPLGFIDDYRRRIAAAVAFDRTLAR